MYKRLIRLAEPEQVSIAEPEQKRIYPNRKLFLYGANPHYP